MTILTRLAALGSGGGGPPPEGVSLIMLHGDGTQGSTIFTDSSSQSNTMNFSGSVFIDTATKKYGTGSIFVGSDGVIYTANAQMQLGNEDFTWEMFINSSSANVRASMDNTSAGAYGGLWLYTGNTILGSTTGSNWDVTINIGTFTDGTWHHVAVCRSGSTIYAFNNGNLQGTVNVGTGSFVAPSPGYMGMTVLSASPPAYFDEVRFTRTAKYTSNFVPPTGPMT